MFSDLTVKRYAAGSWVDGVWTAGSQSTLTIKGSTQPARPDELVNLPEAQRTRAAKKVYSEALLRTADETNLIQADRVVVDGEDWEIQQVDTHFENTLAHYKSIAVRLDRT